MTFRVYCPDGVDRLKARHRTLKEAEMDAAYFSARSSCHDWVYLNNFVRKPPLEEDFARCPGGIHTARPPKEEPEELAWSLDVG